MDLLRIIFSTRMHIFRGSHISIIVMLITGSSEGKDIGLTDSGQSLNFNGSLDEVNRLPIVVARGLLELIDKFLL